MIESLCRALADASTLSQLEGFTFYVMCDATPSRDWPLAYFSKEKVSYDDYNLACIVTFPQYRQKGWATLLIEFSECRVFFLAHLSLTSRLYRLRDHSQDGFDSRDARATTLGARHARLPRLLDRCARSLLPCRL